MHFDDRYIEYRSENDEQLPIRKYLENIRPYLWDMIDNLKTKISGKWEKHLIIIMNFVSIAGSVIYLQLHPKSSNSEIMTGFDTDEINKEMFESIVQRYQVGLET